MFWYSFVTQHNPYRISYDSTDHLSSKSKLSIEKKLLSIYPNPTADNATTIEYNVTIKGLVKIYIINNLGMHVADVLSDYNHATGTFKTNIDLSGLSTGLYYIAFRDYDDYEVKKLMIE